MLDDFKDNNFYNYATNLKKYYHAYLFEVDNIEESFKIILAFTKMIICKNHYTNNLNCKDCNICHLIDKNYYEDLKIIEPEGAFIKKEQVQDIKKNLSLKSSSNSNQVYIIKEADKLNSYAANSLLKFIEEPEDGVYAILITTNKKQILPTIYSRTCLISLKSNKDINYNEDEVKYLINFLNLIHDKKEASLPYLNMYFKEKYNTSQEIIRALNILEVILDTKLEEKILKNSNRTSSFYDIIKSSFNFKDNELIHYLKVIVEFKNKLILVPNLNINLFLDNLAIEMANFEVI